MSSNNIFKFGYEDNMNESCESSRENSKNPTYINIDTTNATLPTNPENNKAKLTKENKIKKINLNTSENMPASHPANDDSKKELKKNFIKDHDHNSNPVKNNSKLSKMEEDSVMEEGDAENDLDNSLHKNKLETNLENKYIVKITRTGKKIREHKNKSRLKNIFNDEQKKEIKSNKYFKKIFYELGNVNIEHVSVKRLRNGYILIFKNDSKDAKDISESLYCKIEEHFGCTVNEIVYLINREGFLEIRITFDL